MRAFLGVFLAIVVPGGLILALEAGLLDPLLVHVPAEPLVRAELEATLPPDELDRRIQDALARGAQDDAEIYAEIALFIDRPLAQETRRQLEESRTLAARVTRSTRSFFEGFITGEGSDSAAFAGAVTSDLTVIGDIRDIGTEGSRMVAGEDYSEIILGLSVVGLAATAGTLASGGAALPVRVGVSLLKIARRAGTLTTGFARELSRLLARAVDFPRLRETLRQVSLADPAATRRAILAYAGNVRSAELFPVLARMDRMRENVGPAETVRLMRHVHTTRDLANVTEMTARLGTKTRGIIELTGKTSLRAFKSAVNILRWLAEWLWAAGAAIAGWLGLRGLGALRRRRRPAPVRIEPTVPPPGPAA